MDSIFDIDMAHLNMGDLNKMGIFFSSEEEGQHFVEIVRKSLEDRLIRSSLRLLTGNEREELASIHSSIERNCYLLKRINGNRLIMKSEQEDLATELLIFRYDIPGAEIWFGADLGNDSVECLAPFRRLTFRMMEQGIYTLRDLVACRKSIKRILRCRVGELIGVREALIEYLEKCYWEEFADSRYTCEEV